MNRLDDLPLPLHPSALYFIPRYSVRFPTPSLLRELPQCEPTSHPRTRRLRMSCLRLATHRTSARMGMGIHSRNLSPVPTRSTMITHSWCVGAFRYQLWELNDLQRTVRCSFDESVRSSMSMASLVVHGDPDRHRSSPSIQSTADTRRHPSLYPPRSKPAMSLPLVGKFLQVSLTIRFAGMLFLIITHRNALPLLHSVTSAPTLFDTQPTVRLARAVSLSLLTHAFRGSRTGGLSDWSLCEVAASTVPHGWVIDGSTF